MAHKHVREYILERKSSKDSTESQIKLAHFLWENDYTPESDGIKKSELEEALDDSSISLDYSIGTSLKHLRDLDLVRRSIRGPQILIIHDDKGIVNGEDLEPLVNAELDSLIDAVQDDDPPGGGDEGEAVADGGKTLRKVVSSELNVSPEKLENHLKEGDVPDKMAKLDSAIDAIEESSLESGGEYYGMRFINNPYRYTLTAQAVNLYEK